MKKRGRPKKGHCDIAEVTTANTKLIKYEDIMPGADHMYHCKQCEKSFRRERHYRSHVCIAAKDYVDITKLNVSHVLNITIGYTIYRPRDLDLNI